MPPAAVAELAGVCTAWLGACSVGARRPHLRQPGAVGASQAAALQGLCQLEGDGGCHRPHRGDPLRPGGLAVELGLCSCFAV